jgi:hypothetical protein
MYVEFHVVCTGNVTPQRRPAYWLRQNDTCPKGQQSYTCEGSNSTAASMKMGSTFSPTFQVCVLEFTPLKRRFTSTRLHGATSQKATFLNIT